MQLFYLLRKSARHARRAMGGYLRSRIALLSGVLAAVFLLHVLAMMIFEGLPVGDSAWLTITTATTVGYGDISAATPAGRWSTVLLMYVGGIFVLAQLAGLVFEAAQVRLEKRRRGKLPVSAANHIVVIGWRETYLRQVVDELRASITELHLEEIVIVSPNLEVLPEDFSSREVLHVNGPVFDDNTLRLAGVGRAARIAILPEPGPDHQRYTNLELVDRLHRAYPEIPIIYAAIDADDKSMSEELGAADAFMFNLNYPDILARAVISVGAEDIIEDFLDRDGIELLVIHLPLNATIGEIVDLTSTKAILLAMRGAGGEYTLHPPKSYQVSDERLIFLIDVDLYGTSATARQTLVTALQPVTEARDLSRFFQPRHVGLVGVSSRLDDLFINRLQQELGKIQLVPLGAAVLSGPGDWKAAEIHQLDAITLLAERPTDQTTDAKTYLLVRQLREKTKYTGRIIAEAVLPQSRARFEEAGASDVLRPVVRKAEILARCIATGAEEILDQLYSSYGSNEFIRLPLDTSLNWAEYSKKVYDVGLPLAFERGNRCFIVPTGDFQPERGFVFLLVNKDRYPNMRAVNKALKQAGSGR